MYVVRTHGLYVCPSVCLSVRLWQSFQRSPEIRKEEKRILLCIMVNLFQFKVFRLVLISVNWCYKDTPV